MVAVIPQVYPIPLEFLGQIPGLPTRDQLDFIPSAQIEKAGATVEENDICEQTRFINMDMSISLLSRQNRLYFSFFI
jgi:hypothetical protein